MKKKHNNTKKESIISEFNQSREHYEKYKDLLEGNPIKAQQELNIAGYFLYTAYENGVKNYLYRRYDELFKSNDKTIKISWQDKENLTHRLFDKGVDGKYLSEQMDQYASPKKNETDIDFNTIWKNSWSVTNQKKHCLDNVDIQKYEESFVEIRKFILTYIDSNAKIDRIQSIQYEELQEACDYWNVDSLYNFCLICDKTTLTGNQLQKLLYINWSLIIDFDINTNLNGLWKSYIDEYEMEPNVFNIFNPQDTDFNYSSNLPYWFHINGLSEYPETVAENERRWNQKYGSVLMNCLTNYRKVFTKPLKIIILNGNAERIKKLIEAVDAVYDDYYKIYLLSSDVQFESVIDVYKDVITNKPISDYEFAQGIANYSSVFNRKNFIEEFSVYGKNGLVGVRPEQYSCFEIPYLGIAENSSEEEKDNVAFYQGRQILSWYGAKEGFAINRFPQFKDIKNDIIKSSQETGSKIISLYHDPGAGGTTLSRMIAYELSKEMPVLLLNSFNVKVAVSQLENFYKKVETSILIVVESSIITDEELKKMRGELMSKAVPHIFLHVCRIRKNMPKNAKYKLMTLNDNEFNSMLDVKLAPFLVAKRRENIIKLGIQDRYPFFMSLYTFDEKFMGVEEYIKHFLVNISSIDYNRLTYISLVDEYANRSLDISFLTGTYKDDFEIFQDSVNEKLIAKKYEGHNCYVKTRHLRFASTILEMRISQNGECDNSRKAANLANLIIEFINYSKHNIMFDPNSTTEVLKNLLIIRDDSGMVYNKFAPVIEKLKELVSNEPDGKERYNCIGLIFKKLVSVYDKEPHFRGHLSRYYSNIEKNYEKGIKEAEKAVELAEHQNSHDALLYHIYGMSIKKYVEEKLYKDAEEYFSYKEYQAYGDLETKIKEELELASEQFRKVRESQNNKIAGYISDIEMCIKAIDFGKQIYDCSTEDFLNKIKNTKNSWYMQYYDRALTLWEGFKTIQVEEYTEFDKVIFKTKSIESKLESLVNGIERTIEMWESYLNEAQEVQRPVIRRFIATAKARLINDPDDEIYLQNINEILKLMEDNIREEPENGDNIRIWFDALRRSESDNSEILLDEAVQKLLTWKKLGDTYEAHYYYFILNCIKAIEGSSVAEGELPRLLDELKKKTERVPYNRRVFEWLGKGRGVKRLIKAYEEYSSNSNHKKYRRRSYDIIEENGQYLEGRVMLYKGERHAEIYAKNLNRIGVMFAPKAQEYQTTSTDVGKSVKFILGFTYSGLRALDKSVHFIDYTVSLDNEKYQPPQIGLLVKCKVQKITDYYLQVLLTDYNCAGSIYKNKLPQGKSLNDYSVGTFLWGRVVGEAKPDKIGREFYQIELEEETKNQKALSKFKAELEKKRG